MLLELDHISKIYGDLRAVDDLNLTVPEGEWLAIVGSSGSGKTTLMNMIGCMDTPSKGSVKLEGRKLEDLNATQLADVRKNLIGLVFQKFYLVPHLTAVENVMVAQYYHSVVDEKQAMEALEKVGLKDRAHHLPGQLSGGEQQRVCVARALINDPKLILADEPPATSTRRTRKSCSTCSASCTSRAPRLSWSPTMRWSPAARSARSCSTMACSSVRSGMTRMRARPTRRPAASPPPRVHRSRARRTARPPLVSLTPPRPRKPAARSRAVRGIEQYVRNTWQADGLSPSQLR